MNKITSSLIEQYHFWFDFDNQLSIFLGQQVEVLGEEDDEMEEYEDENIILDESALEGDQGTSGNVMAVQVR